MPTDRRNRVLAMLRPAVILAGTLTLAIATVPELIAAGPTLRPSSASLDRQNRQARAHDFSFLRNPSEVRRFVQRGYLQPVRSNRDYTLHRVSFPYARPEVRAFLEYVGRGYRRACGERMVVTSLTRPRSHQPRNSSWRSVHPTGMAVDLRYPRRGTCRRWLEGTLLDLERAGTIEASYERHPPHYHLAVFPKPFARFLARGGDLGKAAAGSTYRVARGDSLWNIARRHGVAVHRLRAENGLRSNLIKPGQVLRIPADR